ncbi:two-component system, OmpR family, KDP operon response regulator KdpE [Paenibacillus sp. UNCCL117]|uniref:response regulator transcription factor n=1 Tax=unclassified Paenibacillus TaxID=185978 RepID=UPI00088E271A|nr:MULTISPECIES: response regulator transcription factor [unclassified Paenibacillus]SDD97739.1 two-component system, OmpR family, KDP operon response regulator KdpE [Paenibacillus sp. cl123]SFW56114.1 two-component system, OmpR family, KDP operon response regulator KdpE [Paenibacillus sp. UNCCL117]
MKKHKILIVDDEPKIIRFVSANLKSLGHETASSLSGPEALDMVDIFDPDLILLDIMMPGMDGFEVLRRLRSFCNVPVIVLTARSDSHDKVQGLNLGADDYLTKPFSLEELFARVNAVLRRTDGRISVQDAVSSEIQLGDIKVNFAQRRTWFREREIKLTETEYNLFALLVQNAGKVMMHEQLLIEIWGNEYRDDVEYLRVAIARIRQKIKQADDTLDLIVTYPGVGYMVK